MTYSPFHAMQAAVDIVNTSRHVTNKIAATLFGTDQNGQPFCISSTNYWPPLIEDKIGQDTRIGSSSGTVHAETACILRAPITAGASICITDPFCPNCAKNIAEAGIKKIYIDHKGFEKDFIQRRGEDFTTMSLRVVERAGVDVFSINRAEQTITPIITTASSYRPPEDRPVKIATQGTATFDKATLINVAASFVPAEKKLSYAAAWATDLDGRSFILIGQAHVSVGYTEGSVADRMEMEDMHTGKYSFVMEPINRLIMAATRAGLKIDPRLVVSSRVPTSRELVNMVAAELTTLHILDSADARDVAAVNALYQLTHVGIMKIG